MRIQPVQGSGMNAGYDAATKSITISNEGNTPFLYFRVNNKIPIDDQSLGKGYYRFYDFYEVYWDGNDFIRLEGGLSASYDTKDTCPKLYAMPYDIDSPQTTVALTGNVGVSGQGLVYIGRYRGVDSSDGRDVYEFIRSLDPSSKVLIEIESETNHVNGYYPAISSGVFDNSLSSQYSRFWAKEINGSELISGRKYAAFFTGGSYNPYPNDPVNTDNRPVVSAINSSIYGPTGITVVTDISCVGGAVSATYGTFYPSQTSYITQDSKKTFISLTDTPSSYSGYANYYLCVNQYSNGVSFTVTPPSTTTIPSMSFINLKDCPQSYPAIPATGTLFLTPTPSGIVFSKFSFSTGTNSVQPSVSGLVEGVSFKLVNDKENPGANMYYGTDENGNKGWYSLPT